MRRLIALLMLVSGVAMAAPIASRPRPPRRSARILTLEATGNGDGHDFVTVVKKGSPEGSYDAYVYVRPGQLKLQLPGDTRRIRAARAARRASPYPTLARQALKSSKASTGHRASAPASRQGRCAIRSGLDRP